MFGKLKDVMGNISEARAMQQKAKEIEDKLKSSYFEVKSENVTMKANAKKEIISIKISDNVLGRDVEQEIVKLLNEVSRKADQIAMQEMRSLFTN